ncbi:MAG: ribosome assembly RNA-binding protein YhbY [Gemmatimonadota bacterium]|jgi:RNA-binding protein
MTDLTSKQRAHLRALAHSLKPVVHVGVDGLSDAALQSIREAFNTRELLKVKVLQGAPESAWDTADRIVATLDDVHVAQTIGRTVVLYRRHPENPEIRLPGA